MKSKRGVIEVQFNWIFILIVGAVILLFFVSIVRQQKSIFERDVEVKVAASLKAIFSGSEVSAGTASLKRFAGGNIRYDCQGYALGSAPPFDAGVSFAPSKLEEGDLLLWSLEWEIPYKVMNFLYVTSPEVRYVFLYEGEESKSMAEEIYEELPPEFPPRKTEAYETQRVMMDKEMIQKKTFVQDHKTDQGTPFKDEGDDAVRFVTVDVPADYVDPNTGVGMVVLPEPHDKGLLDKDVDWSVLQIDTDSDTNRQTGKLRFYEDSSGDSGVSYYLGKEMLMAALFSSNINTYHCNIHTAFKKMSVVTEIYIARTEALISDLEAAGYTGCLSSATKILDELKSVKEASDQIVEEFDESPEDPDIESVRQNMQEIYQSSKKLESENYNLQYGSCPKMY
ncbi:hypothetical protein GF351_01230 [Candidatus Woesearchaeota archaeon]|nr:hypothetical protein [Candidatus Woesearchaeota archaeon]